MRNSVSPRTSILKEVSIAMEIHNDQDRQALLQQLLKSLSPSDEAQLQKILADKDAQKKMLSTPQAQELMKQLFGK